MDNADATIDDLIEWQIKKVHLSQQECDWTDEERKNKSRKMMSDAVKNIETPLSIDSSQFGTFPVASAGESRVARDVDVLYKLAQIKDILLKKSDVIN